MKQLICMLTVCLFSIQLLSQGKSPTKEQLNSIEAIMAPIRVKVEKALKKADKNLYDSYLIEIKNFSQLRDTARRKWLQDLESKYYVYLKNGYKAANIDEVSVKKQISDVLTGFGTASYKFTDFLGIVSVYTPPPSSPPAGNGCIEFKCPLSVINTTMSAQDLGLAFDPGSADCTTFTYSSGTFIASADEEFNGLGEFATIQPNMSRVDVTSKLSYDYDGWAFACLGGSYCDSSVGIIVKGPGVNKRFELDPAGWAVSPVIWYSHFEMTGSNDVIQASFTPKSSGGDYKVQVYSKSYAMAAVVGLSSSSSLINNIKFLKVCQIKK